jgi:hypothetical protein
MNKNEYYQSLAHDTWPQFEHKMRRVRLFQKLKKLILWSGSGVVLLGILTLLLSREHTERNIETKKMAKIQAVKLPKRPSVHPLKITTEQASNSHFFDSISQHQTIQEAIAAWNTIQTVYPKVAQGQKMTLKHRADLTLACAQLNFQPQTWSLQENGHSLAALLDEHTLLIMNLMYGEEPLLAVPSDFSGDYWYRPSFFPSNMFVQLSFYDVSDWIQDPLSVRITVNRSENPVLLPRRYTRSNSVVIPGTASRVYTAYDRENPGTFFYRTQSMLSPALKKARYHTLIYYADRPAVSFNPYLFHRSDTLVVLSAQAQRMTLLSMNGTVLASKQIEFKGRGLHALKRKEFLYDPVRNEIYIVAPSNFHFIFFKLDLQTGVAQEVYQTPTVWKGAEFEIRDQQLSYLYKEDLIDVLLKPH